MYATLLCLYSGCNHFLLSAKFPEASITVKMHLLEDHMVPFLRQWNWVGYGLMGEQGAESVHAEFNSLLCRYTNIPYQVCSAGASSSAAQTS